MANKQGYSKDKRMINAYGTCDIVAIGTSLGGLKALNALLPELADDFSVPVVIVLHRQAGNSDFLIEALQQHTAGKIEEAIDKAPIRSSTITVAPADYHLLVEDRHFALSLEDSVNMARPSIDVLFESIADAYGAAAMGIVLTGGGHDGAKGLAAIARVGGHIMVQAPDSAESPHMPEAAIAATATKNIFPLPRIISEMRCYCSTDNSREENSHHSPGGQ